MGLKYSSSWISSKQPRKQRKYRVNAPLHIKRKLLSSGLSKELKKKYAKRSITVRKGDTVRINLGLFKKKGGKVNRVDTKRLKIYIDGIENIKKDGSKAFYPINPSNITITELDLNDKKRLNSLNRGKKNAS